VFAAGITNRTIPLTIIGDQVAEPTETFVVKLTSGTAVVLGDTEASITVTDND
jgi:hypothetical protein